MHNVSLLVYSASDLATAKPFFRELIGGDPYVESAQYVGYKQGATEIGLVPSSDGREGALAYWDVDDIAERVRALVAAGGIVAQEVTDVGYGLLVASVKHPSGAIVGLRQQPRG